jgi:hypothetical protein
LILRLLPNKNKGKDKIFCIGRNKTGTTSLETALKELGYKMGDQFQGEELIKDYKNRNWKPIIKYCKTAEAFQDAPFSWPYTWMILHHYFPEAKFILTVREEENWYSSLTRFHANLFSDGKTPPKMEQLQQATYHRNGFMWEVNRAVWKTPENDLYNKEILISNYRSHNFSVRNYFEGNPNFLELDISNEGSYILLCKFLNKKPKRQTFPHLNKSK